MASYNILREIQVNDGWDALRCNNILSIHIVLEYHSLERVELKAFTAAFAICSSCPGVTPLTPTAPTCIPFITIGTPPLINTNGAESKEVLLLPSETLAASSNAPVGFRNRAAVLALPQATSYDAANASSQRFTRIGMPPASAMAMVTAHPFPHASSSAASIASCAAADVRLNVGCNMLFVSDVPDITTVLIRSDAMIVLPGVKLIDEQMKHRRQVRTKTLLVKTMGNSLMVAWLREL